MARNAGDANLELLALRMTLDEIRSTIRSHHNPSILQAYPGLENEDVSIWQQMVTSITLVVAISAAFALYKFLSRPRWGDPDEIRKRRLQNISHRCEQSSASADISNGAVEVSDQEPEQVADVTRLPNGLILNEASVQDIRRRWKREQASMRFQKKRNDPPRESAIHSAVSSAITVDPTAPAGEGTDSASCEEGATQQKVTKRKAKHKLPPPERFLPKLPPQSEETTLCQPVSSPEETPVSPTGGTSTSAPHHQTLDIQRNLRDILVRLATGQRRDISKAEEEATVCKDEMTTFLFVRTLPNADHASFLLKKIAKEFMPIVKRRSYSVLLVAEFCCCTDATRAARGEVRNAKRIKAHTSGGSEDQCGGYNRTIPLGRGKTFHQIFIRLRDRANHYEYMFKDYTSLARTMAHELAHCVHQNHGPGFHQLMKEIQEEHRELCLSGACNLDESAEEQFGFDIYGASSSRTRF